MSDDTKISQECSPEDCSSCKDSDGNGGCAHAHDGENPETMQQYLELTYKQNQVIGMKLSKMSETLKKAGNEEAAGYLAKSISDFEKGNMWINLVLSLIK